MPAEPKPHITAFASDALEGMYRFTIPMRALIERQAATGILCVDPGNTQLITPGLPILLQGRVTIAPALIRTATRDHCRIVQDVDSPYWSANSEVEMEHQLRSAELVTVSTEPLAEELRKRGYDPIVLPTTIDPRDWSAQPPRAERTRPRIGWYALRPAHLDELALIEKVAQTLFDDADFVFFGCVPRAMNDTTSRIEHHAPVALAFFPALLAALDLDMLLAPLAHNASNECQSNLQLLQAGMLGYPVLATDIEPHRTLPVVRLPNKPAAWIAAIGERLGASKALRREGETLRRAVHADFLAESWANQYLARWTGTALVAAHA